jgi:autotransporter-associated beta strand protein
LTKSGTGTFTLNRSAGNTYTGITTVNGGKLLVNNSTGSGTGTNSVIVNNSAVLGGTGRITGAVTINNGAHIAPGASIESLDVGALTLTAGSILDFEFDTVAGADHSDLINVINGNGLTINGGILNIINAGTMTGGVYKLIDYSGTLSGSLSNITFGTTPAGFTYNLVNNAANTSIDLVVTMPGDINGDGIVDGGDYVILRHGLGTTYTQADIDTWRAHFGETAPTAASSAAVPEPSTWMLLNAVSAMLLFRFGAFLPQTRF